MLTDVLGYFETNKRLNFARLESDRHKGFFVRRRAQFLGCVNPSWITEAGHNSLKTRIDNEYTQLDAFLTTKASALTTSGGDPRSPQHLDLHDVAKPKTTTRASVVASNEARARRRRSYRVRAIGWRAAGIHDNLWQAAAGATTATLQQNGLSTIIDRRLRLIERMNYTISSARALGGPWRFSGGGPTGPWNDGFRVRMFEYPRIPRNVVSQVVGFVGSGNIASETDPSFQPSKPWKWEAGHHRLYYNVGQWPGIRFPDNESPDWTADPGDHYIQQLAPSATGAAAVDTLFTPNTDWWGRAWLFCDHVLSALHIESLLFGLRRRVQPASDSSFNAIVTGHPSGYVALGAFVGANLAAGTARLMRDAADPYFENVMINEADLQLGDHLIFWNSFVYAEISAGEWRLENSVVIDVDSDQTTGGIRRDRLHLQGHGTPERAYPAYQLGIASHMNHSLYLARRAIAAAPAGTTALDWNRKVGLLVKWEPYEAFNSPGAWWVRMDLTTATGATRWGSIDDALKAVPGSVATDSTPGAGYTPPPSSTAVFFPLFRPAVHGGWAGYLAARRTNAAYRAPKNLVAFRADGSMMPGLHHAGTGKPFPIIRPKVQP